MDKFWKYWLVIFFSIFMAMGMFIGVFNQTKTFDSLFGQMIERQFWGELEPVAQAKVQSDFNYGLSGGVMASQGMFLLIAALAVFHRKEKWFRNANMAGALLWFSIDQYWSISVGFWFNVVFNTFFLIFWILPFVVNWKKFK